MLLYNRFFSEDTPQTNRRAWKIMLGIYFVIAGAGLYFFVYSLFLTLQIQWKTLVQALIMLAFGGWGIMISLRRRT
jgi:magnesium-transporting ATPase (P-type)